MFHPGWVKELEVLGLAPEVELEQVGLEQVELEKVVWEFLDTTLHCFRSCNFPCTDPPTYIQAWNCNAHNCSHHRSCSRTLHHRNRRRADDMFQVKELEGWVLEGWVLEGWELEGWELEKVSEAEEQE